MAFDQRQLIRMNRGLADQAMRQVFQHLGVQQCLVVEVLEHRRRQAEAVRCERGHQPRDHRPKRRAVDRHGARPAYAQQRQQIVAADAQRQDAPDHARRAQHLAEQRHLAVVEHLGRFQRRHQHVAGVLEQSEISVEVGACGFRDDEAGQMLDALHGQHALQHFRATHAHEAIQHADRVHVLQRHGQVEQRVAEFTVGHRVFGAENHRAQLRHLFAIGDFQQILVGRRYIQRCTHWFISHPAHS